MGSWRRKSNALESLGVSIADRPAAVDAMEYLESLGDKMSDLIYDAMYGHGRLDVSEKEMQKALLEALGSVDTLFDALRRDVND
jgi:hypothetical protein